jgi:NAD(P)-dependent dehydrogenase (short-subunit alcohol dehydrogenase family)
MAADAARVAVVTDGARGIGFCIAQRLIADGCRLVVWDRNLRFLEDADEALGHELAVEVDVTDEASVAAAVAQTIKAMGSLDRPA